MEQSPTESAVKVPVKVRMEPDVVAKIDALVERGGSGDTRSSVICRAVRAWVQGTLQEMPAATRLDSITQELKACTRLELLTILEELGIIDMNISVNASSPLLHLPTNTPSTLVDAPQGATSTQQIDIEAILNTMGLRKTAHNRKYELVRWILEQSNTPFTAKDARESGAGNSACYDNLLKLQRGEFSIPGFSLVRCNPGRYPVTYKLVPVTSSEAQ
jgi:Arc/MetJ-type ribon-helix-helix transcriptional regulator